MKKVFVFLMLIALFIPLCGCVNNPKDLAYQGLPDGIIEENEVYTMTCRDGKLYMKFHKQIENGSQQSMEAAELYFSSIQEMKQTFEQCNFTDYQLSFLQSMAKDSSENELMVLDTKQLWEPEFPEKMEITQVMFNETGNYSFAFGDSDSKLRGFISLVNQELFQKLIEMEYTSFFYNKNIVVDREEFDPDRNAMKYYYHTSAGSFLYVHYQPTSNEKKLTVIEIYGKIYDTGFEVPHRMIIFGEENGCYYDLQLYGLSERPSVKWLESFGLKPYVETETQ